MNINLANNVLKGFASIGSDPRKMVLAKTATSASIKGPLTLLDTKADKETRLSACIWQVADDSASVLGQLAIFPALPVIGRFLAKNVFQIGRAHV